jgi:hypothetical protein
MLELETKLGSQLSVYSTAIAKLPKEYGFRKAVKEHILDRLRVKAKDVLLDSVQDPTAAVKLDEINSERLNRSAVTKLLERKDVLQECIDSVPSMESSEIVVDDQIIQAEELELSIKFHKERLQALGYTMTLEPNFNMDLLRCIASEQPKAWYTYRDEAETCDSLLQMRLHSFIASLNISSDFVMKDDALALIESCLAKRPDKILADQKFWGLQEE